MLNTLEPIVYQGQFGPFSIDDHDRREVLLYRSGLAIAAFAFGLGSILVLTQPLTPSILTVTTLCFWLMTAGLGLSLWTIHIYLVALHRTLQSFWAIGTLTAIILTITQSLTLVATVYNQPLTLFGIGFTFAALTGIFFKEAFCFNRLETKFLTPLVPFLLLGHLSGFLPATVEKFCLTLWAGLFFIFALRKVIQPIPPDIGDKSVFTYLKQQAQTHN
ncbi:MAG: DUF2301 domain-containing membrane protein [Synechocystis sp.]|jgi:uncharacterized integral membrane protein